VTVIELPSIEGRGGSVTDPKATDPSVRAIQEFNRRLTANPRLETILLPILRHHVDGLAIARVRESAGWV
jgi:predicted O-methyltransferase YrrM